MLDEGIIRFCSGLYCIVHVVFAEEGVAGGRSNRIQRLRNHRCSILILLTLLIFYNVLAGLEHIIQIDRIRYFLDTGCIVEGSFAHVGVEGFQIYVRSCIRQGRPALRFCQFSH